MPGRYTLTAPVGKIEEHFALTGAPAFNPRFNLAPMQNGFVIRGGPTPGTREAAVLRWGLVPFWTKDLSSAPLLMNARSETAAAKPAFREPFRHRRCLVVADGFFEWKQRGEGKQPYYFTADHGNLFAMAGLWDRRPAGGDGKGEALETFTILTTNPNDLIASFHDRMPAILESQYYDDWLNPFLAEPDSLALMLKPYPAMHMLARIVSTRVNSTKFDDPACLEPPDPGSTGDAHAPANRGANRDARDRPSSEPGQLDLGLG